MIFNKLFKPRETESHEGKKELTIQETWDFVFWSFFYSRGKTVTQELLFEMLIRNYNLPNKFSAEEITDKTLRDAVSFRNSTRHRAADYDSEFEGEKELKTNTAYELTRLANKLLTAKRGRGDFKKIDNDTLKLYTALSFLYVDHLWLTSKGSKISHIQKFFLSDRPIPGGPIYQFIKKEIHPKVEQILNEPIIPKENFFENEDSSEESRPSNILWKDITTILTDNN